MSPGKRTIIAKSTPDPVTGCWLWTGYINQVTGYGQIGRNTIAHRLAYEIFTGSIPEDAHIHHTCEVRTCVNPAHLVVLTPGEHLRETLAVHGPGYLWENRSRQSKPFCKYGHELGDDLRNYYVSPAGRRYCLACRKIADARPRPSTEKRRAYWREYSRKKRSLS